MSERFKRMFSRRSHGTTGDTQSSVTTQSSTTLPSPPQRQVSGIKRALTSFRNLLHHDTSVTTTVAPPSPPPLVHGPAPRTQQAFQQLQKNPSRFMRRNLVKPKGIYKDRSGPRDFVMYNTGPIGKRRNSVSGDMQSVFEYRISSQKDFQTFASQQQKSLESYDPHTFTAQHISMDPAHKDKQGKPERSLDSTTAYIKPGHKQNFITHPVTGCSIVRKNNNLSHWWPYFQVDNNYKHGEELEQGLRTHSPQSQVMGPSEYDKSGTNLFIQSSRRGSIHIHRQSGETGRGTSDWSSTVEETYFPPVFNGLSNRVRHTRGFYEQNVRNARKGVEFNLALDQRIQQAKRFVTPDKLAPSEVADHEWND